MGHVDPQISRTESVSFRSSSLEYDSPVAALERVKVDLGKVFEKGQAYVALSRATCLEGLQVMGFSADKVRFFFSLKLRLVDGLAGHGASQSRRVVLEPTRSERLGPDGFFPLSSYVIWTKSFASSTQRRTHILIPGRVAYVAATLIHAMHLVTPSLSLVSTALIDRWRAR